MAKPDTARANHQDYLREFQARLWFSLIALLVIAGAGIVGFRHFDNCSWLQAAYQTVCVLATLGLPHSPPNPASEAFTIVLAICGIGSFAYIASALVRVLVSDDFQRAIKRRRIAHRMDKFQNHFIICGFGRLGEIVAAHLEAQHHAYVVVDRNDSVFEELEERGLNRIHGDASHEAVLEQAGLGRAQGVIVATSSDAENLLITMTARQLNHAIPIIVRADEESNTPKFLRAGATRVVTPNTTGASQIALAATKPYVTDLIDLATGARRQKIQLRELVVPESSLAHEKTLRELALGSRFGVIVIAIKPHDQEMQFNPSAQARLAASDTLIVVGQEENITKMEQFLAERAK